MPKYKKCNKDFPNRIIIDGKQRVLISRKYCLECSPFGLHNTIQIEKKSINKDSIKICIQCNKEYIYNTKKGCSTKICTACTQKNKRERIKQKVLEYKGGQCELCGYNKCKGALIFHHRDPDKKEFNLSGNYNLSWNRIKSELDKCQLLCANCHAEIHDELIKKVDLGLVI